MCRWRQTHKRHWRGWLEKWKRRLLPVKNRGSWWFQKEIVGSSGKPPHPHSDYRYQSSFGRHRHAHSCAHPYRHTHDIHTQATHTHTEVAGSKCRFGFSQGCLWSFNHKEVTGTIPLFCPDSLLSSQHSRSAQWPLGQQVHFPCNQ